MQRIEMLRNDSKMFFFNLKFLKDTKELHIGDGSDTDHLTYVFVIQTLIWNLSVALVFCCDLITVT